MDLVNDIDFVVVKLALFRVWIFIWIKHFIFLIFFFFFFFFFYKMEQFTELTKALYASIQKQQLQEKFEVTKHFSIWIDAITQTTN